MTACETILLLDDDSDRFLTEAESLIGFGDGPFALLSVEVDDVATASVVQGWVRRLASLGWIGEALPDGSFVALLGGAAQSDAFAALDLLQAGLREAGCEGSAREEIALGDSDATLRRLSERLDGTMLAA